MKTKLLQIYYDLRHQPVVAWVTILGTAISIFLIMVVVMIQNVTMISFAPETHRDRMLYGINIDVHSTQDNGTSGSGRMSYGAAKYLYANLDSVEQTSYFDYEVVNESAKGTTGEIFETYVRYCDADFFKIYEHPLVTGRYFTAEEVAAGNRVMVVSEATAARLFGNEKAVGQTALIDHDSYTVVGVVKNSSRLATMAFGDLFKPISVTESLQDLFGDVSVALLVKEGVDFEAIRDQVRARYALFDTENKPSHIAATYHESPYDQATVTSGTLYSNVTPDSSKGRIMRYCIYALLLIIPAINLSSMLHSRMRRRVEEIGIRRAFGCTKSRIVADILVENMIVTIVGGVVGLAAGIIFALCYDGLFIDDYGVASHPALSLLLNWVNVATAFVACLALNILSALVPAIHASRINTVEAINSNHN